MDTPKDLIGSISGGRVLDVATGNGNFVGFLLEGLESYDEIIGIDTSEKAATSFAAAFKDKPGIRFVRMDASRMDFPDASFDTVCISNSLHHMPDPGPVLAEMKRLLHPGGYFIILEMFRDGQAETQMTHVLLHHWWAAIDRAQGVVHNETYTRQQVTDIVAGLGLRDVAIHDLSDTEDDPKDPGTIKQLEDIIDHSIQHPGSHPDLQQRGEELRRRVQEVGFHNAASVLVIGRK